MAAIEAGKISQMIALGVNRFFRSIRDFSATVEQVVDENDVRLHILDMGTALNLEDNDNVHTRAPVSYRDVYRTGSGDQT